jgi:hypothetical protein
MEARIVAALAAVLSAWIVMPANAFESVCTPAEQANCAARNVAGGDTCMQWVCRGLPTQTPNHQPAGTCVQINAAVGTACSNKQACVHSGTCGPTGGCQANVNAQQACGPTATGMRDQILCSCKNFACQALMADGKPYTGNVSTMCVISTVP